MSKSATLRADSGHRDRWAERFGLTPRRIIVGATAGSLVLSFILSALWFILVRGTSRFEPTVESLGLLAGIAGVVAERRANAAEQRDRALAAVRNELNVNSKILDALARSNASVPRREIYRRLYSSAVDAALSSVVLLPKQDELLSAKLHEWRNTVVTFNQRLAVAEILAFTAKSEHVLTELHEILHGKNGPVKRIRDQLDIVLASLP